LVTDSTPRAGVARRSEVTHCCYTCPVVSVLVKLEDDLGEHGEWVMLYGVIPANHELDFPVLRCIDPFGKTVFNHLQMADFLREWERVGDRAGDESEKQSWQKIKEMAEQCRSDRDLYLRFVGH